MTPHVSTTLLRTQTDARLVELIAAGHDRAFDAIVDRYRRPLLRYARRFLKEESRAEDVVQSAFVSAWTALGEGTSVRDLRPWLYRIVHNGALNAMKKPGGDDSPLIEASDLRPGPEVAVEQREEVQRALDTIAELPERQRTALLAVALEGRSHADVGVDLGLNDAAVRQLVSRARATLRVAATALTPWPAAVWLASVGGPQAGETAGRIGEIVGGAGAGTLFGGGALKAGAVIAAAGAVAVGVPEVSHVARTHHRSTPSAKKTTTAAPAQASAASAAAARPVAVSVAGHSGAAGSQSTGGSGASAGGGGPARSVKIVSRTRRTASVPAPARNHSNFPAAPERGGQDQATSPSNADHGERSGRRNRKRNSGEHQAGAVKAEDPPEIRSENQQAETPPVQESQQQEHNSEFKRSERSGSHTDQPKPPEPGDTQPPEPQH